MAALVKQKESLNNKILEQEKYLHDTILEYTTLCGNDDTTRVDVECAFLHRLIVMEQRELRKTTDKRDGVIEMLKLTGFKQN
jgi:hypothetical protein